MDTRKIDARTAAYQSLIACERDKKYSNLEIDAVIRRHRLEGAEKGLYTTLTYGVIEMRITLDYLISRLSSKPVEQIDPEARTLLRMGLYQLIRLTRIPERAAVSETVNLAKKFAPRAASFINAVLRSFLRQMDRDNLPHPDKNDRIRYLSVRYSVGEDAAAILDAAYPDAEEILAAFSHQPPVTLRVNTLKISREELLARLTADGIAAEACRYSPFGVKLENATISSEISELISAGFVYIQDEASQLAVRFAAPEPGMTVIDTCACPGGKSFSAAILMENRGIVKSFDLHKNKLSLIQKGAEKMGISIIETAEKNGSVPDETLTESADLVLCDVPCSGLGVIAKKPEIRYKSASEILRLPEIQYAILKNAADYVKPGGALCYSTCTLNPAENEAVVRRFLAGTDAFAPEEFGMDGITSDGGMLTLMPHIHNTDGFFIAKFRKIKK
ncbi:MAG: 16S rRNA (cytosine(967)-C(5))-methyltransferase RsmB [Ruminococcaceae bacterium]|nr:16S rRNA (cytosine(967)-C(5))-methyltransferase RsmB [Oscillospiraceae bacterium]